MVVSHCCHHKLLCASGTLKPVEPVCDGSGRSHEPRGNSVLDQSGLFRRECFDSPGVRVWDGAVTTADTVNPLRERRSEILCIRIILCYKDISGNHHIRFVENRRRRERRTVCLDGVKGGAGADVIIRDERQASGSSGSRTLTPAASEQPELDFCALSRCRRKLYPVLRLELPTEQGDDVIQLVIEIRHLSARQLKDGTPAANRSDRINWADRNGVGNRVPSTTVGSRGATGSSLPATASARRCPDRPSPRSIRPGYNASMVPNASTTAAAV